MTRAEAAIRREMRALATLTQHGAAATGPVGYLIGAGYGLLSASRLGYRAVRPRGGPYAAALRRVGRHLATGSLELASDPGGKPWLARFYFNSALHRLAAAADRLRMHPKGQHTEPPSVARVRKEVNKLKHDIKQTSSQRGKGVLEGRDVSMATAIAALKALTRHCRSEGLLKAV